MHLRVIQYVPVIMDRTDRLVEVQRATEPLAQAGDIPGLGVAQVHPPRPDRQHAVAVHLQYGGGQDIIGDHAAPGAGRPHRVPLQRETLPVTTDLHTADIAHQAGDAGQHVQPVPQGFTGGGKVEKQVRTFHVRHPSREQAEIRVAGLALAFGQQAVIAVAGNDRVRQRQLGNVHPGAAGDEAAIGTQGRRQVHQARQRAGIDKAPAVRRLRVRCRHCPAHVLTLRYRTV